jgi:hypothetical protein
MAISFNRLVQGDLRIVLEYYERAGGRGLADRFFEELTALISSVEQRPTSFHPVAEGFRRANFPSFPYHFLFRERGGLVRVLVLRHHQTKQTFGTKRK